MSASKKSFDGVQLAYSILPAGLVADLPDATLSLGMRGVVTDSNAAFTAGIGAAVATGGANIVPVFCDGTNWRIG